MPKGKVLEVVDGDTVRLPQKKFIRLAGVDAPEKNQKGGSAATQKLSELIKGKVISYTEDAKSYGRTVGTVKSGAKDICNAMNKFLKKRK